MKLFFPLAAAPAPDEQEQEAEEHHAQEGDAAHGGGRPGWW